MFDSNRPLADRASASLIELCNDLANLSLSEFDKLADEMRRRGPRVASAVRSLATAVSGSPLGLEASWTEPGQRRVVSSWSAVTAGQVAQFIEGRSLDAEVYVLSGAAVTVSKRERWLIDEDGGSTVHVAVGDLSDDDFRSVRPDDRVWLEVEATTRVAASGESRTSRRALRLQRVVPPTDEDE